jgi:hypothetical protein
VFSFASNCADGNNFPSTHSHSSKAGVHNGYSVAIYLYNNYQTGGLGMDLDVRENVLELTKVNSASYHCALLFYVSHKILYKWISSHIAMGSWQYRILCLCCTRAFEE